MMVITPLSANVYDTEFSKEEVLYRFKDNYTFPAFVLTEDNKGKITLYEEDNFTLRHYNYYLRVYPDSHWRFNAEIGRLNIFVPYKEETEI